METFFCKTELKNGGKPGAVQSDVQLSWAWLGYLAVSAHAGWGLLKVCKFQEPLVSIYLRIVDTNLKLVTIILIARGLKSVVYFAGVSGTELICLSVSEVAQVRVLL